MSNFEWRDIKEIEGYREFYEFNDYVVLFDMSDEGEEPDLMTDISYGIGLMPEKTLRFICIPYDEEKDE